MRLFVVAESAVPLVHVHRVAGVGGGVVRLPLRHDLFVPLPPRLLHAHPLRLDPAEVGRIDIGRQPAVEAVQLIGAHKVHLAGQHGVVPRVGEVVGEGGQVLSQRRPVVDTAVDGGVAARHQTRPGRGAQRIGRVGRVEADPLRAQALQRGRLHHRMAVGAGEGGDHLVGDDKKYVGPLAHGPNSSLSLCAGAGERCQGQRVCRRLRVLGRLQLCQHGWRLSPATATLGRGARTKCRQFPSAATPGGLPVLAARAAILWAAA